MMAFRQDIPWFNLDGGDDYGEILKRNRYRAVKDQGGYVGYEASLVNHSTTRYNCMTGPTITQGQTPMITFIALRPIRKGEELTVCYVSPVGFPTQAAYNEHMQRVLNFIPID